MGKKATTLVHKDRNPSEYTTDNPTVITQLKSQGYAVKEDTEQATSGAQDNDQASVAEPAEGKARGGRAGGSK